MSCFAGPNIITTGLRHSTDLSNIKSYTSGSTITDVITKSSGTNIIPNAAVSWMNTGITTITITAVVKRLSGIPGYSVNPLTKYSDTTSNTFNLYLFGNNSGTTPSEDGRIAFYSNRGGAWGTISNSNYIIQLNETAVITLQYNSTTGGQLWINGNKQGARTASGILGSSNIAPLSVYTPSVSSTIIMYYSSIYDRELTDTEVKQNFEALRGRYGI